jgi:hypothetical protein
MAELNLNAHLRQTTETAYNNLVNDISALDEDKAAGSPNPALRPAIKLLAECGSVNGLLASLVATGQAEQPAPEQREAFYASITTRAEALAVLEDGTQKLYAAIDATAAETWGDTISGPFGPWSRLSAAGFAALHMMYHDGQLNSVHLLHGDTEMHWK